jgi:hypothetical protein
MANKKTKFRTATITLAESLNVEPAEALRIARMFTNRHAGLTEAEACNMTTTRLNECVPSQYNDDADFDIFRALNAVDATCATPSAFLKVARRFRQVRNERRSWDRAISTVSSYLSEFESMPDRFCKKEFDASHIRETAAKLYKLLGRAETRPRYCNPEPETLGF